MTTPRAAIDAYIRQREKAMMLQIIRSLAWVGEQCRNEAIIAHRYKNQTGNLESSTGYVVSVDGRIKTTGGFKGSQKHDEASAKEGKGFAKTIATTEQGICLVVVAGKNYAKYVEDKGLNVLISAEQLAERLIPKMVKQLIF